MRFMVKVFKLLVATLLSLVFTLALSYATIILPGSLDSQLKTVYPDLFYGNDNGLMTEFVNQVRPFGYASFMLAMVMVLYGFVSNKKGLTSVGTLAFYLPTFASFAYSMFFLAGLGMTRIIWIPLLDVHPLILRLGDISIVPVLAFLILNNLSGRRELTWLSISLMGFAVFFIGVVTWFYARLEGRDVIGFWAYRHSRHPQYVGLIMMSYGFMLGSSGFIVMANNEFLTTTQSLPWVVSTLILICVAFTEEIDMLEKHGESYELYLSRTPFMLPLPKIVISILTAPARWLLGGNFSTSRRKLAYFFVLYFIISVVLSIPFLLVFPSS
jgi:protein-S-isoprenylcysteine O-methyltransferase Ste14